MKQNYLDYTRAAITRSVKEICNLHDERVGTHEEAATRRIRRDEGIGECSGFINSRLDSDEVSFWEPLPKLKIETFKTTNKRSLTASNEKVITLSVDRDLFGRLFVVAKRRGIKLREIFSYELCCVPVSLVHPDGTLRKQQKAH